MDIQEIADILNFDADDLIANRKGRLSDWQHKQLRRYVIFYRLCLYLSAIVVGTPLAYAFILNLRDNLWTVQSLCVYILFCACLITIWLGGWSRYMTLQKSVKQQKVDSIQGNIFLHEQKTNSSRGNGVKHYICIGDTKLAISHQQHEALRDLEAGEYTIYFEPNSQQILCLEQSE